MSQNIEGGYDEQFKRLTAHDLGILKVYNVGNYERENLVLIADKDISSLYDYILICMVEGEDGLPDYGKCRFLTFDDIELKAGDRSCVYAYKGENLTRRALRPENVTRYAIGIRVLRFGTLPILPLKLWNVKQL